MTEFNIGERVRYNAVDGAAVRGLDGSLGVVTDALSPYSVKVWWDHEDQERLHAAMYLELVQDAPAVPKTALPHDSAERKTYPLMSGLMDYFPSALAAVANHSFVNNEKHNPGEPMHWSRNKSADHLDAAMRHLLERDLEGAAWRVLAALQMQLEGEGHPVAPAAR